MMAFFEEILPLGMILFWGLLSGMFWLWLRQKLGKERFALLCAYAKRAVAAAEQLLQGKSGAEKLTYVQEQLTAAGFSLTSDAQIAIESAVAEQKSKSNTNI